MFSSMSTKESKESGWAEERKRLMTEVRNLQSQLATVRTKFGQTKEKLAAAQAHTLTLMQTNRMLVDVAKSYAEREATILANWKTLQQAFPTSHSSE